MAAKKKAMKSGLAMPSATAQQVHAVVNRVLSDSAYARKIQASAKKALAGGAGSKAWKAYFANFAASPGELMALGQPSSKGCGNTIITLSTVTTPFCFTCGLTTTTTTSNN